MSQGMKQKFKNVLKLVVFICIAFFVFSRVTYLFREVSCSRDNITGFDKEGDLDVVCIGASTMVEYYQPLTAWNEYGYTSYNYATLYGQIDLYWKYMDRVLETHDPDLFVVDLRMLTTLDEDVYEQGVRFWSDSLPVLSADRCLSLYDYFKRHTLGEAEEKVPYYFDIAKYHTNTTALGSEDNWRYISNTGKAQYKGYVFSDVHHFFDEPVVNTEEKAELTQMQSKVLYHLLDYCKKKDLEVLFVVCPYIVLEEDQKVYNTVKDIVASYGYNYVNANEYYNEIGLDFATDLKNINHVNSIGAEKYTRFLGGYIMKTYNISTHTEDDSYAQWNEEYERFAKELETVKTNVYQTVKDKYEASDLAGKLAECENFYEWSSSARNNNYTAIVCADLKQCNFDNISIEDKQQLINWGIDVTDDDYYLGIRCGDEIIYSEQKKEAVDYTGWLGVVDGLGQVSCEVRINETGMKLMIGDKEYTMAGDGVYLLLFDNNFKKVVDNLILYVNEDGRICVVR